MEESVRGRVVVRTPDGTPASDVSVRVFVASQVFRGTTDSRGRYSFGPLPDGAYDILVRCTPDDAPTLQESRSITSLRAPLEFTLTRSRPVLGRIVHPDASPADGVRVAPWRAETGDPERSVTADAEGRFVLPGVGVDDGLAVYDRKPDLTDLASAAMRTSLLNPLLLRTLAGTDDVGTITLPPLGRLTLVVDDTGGRAASGVLAYWRHAGHSHGSLGFRQHPDGAVRIERIPAGSPVLVDVEADDREHGRLRERHPLDTWDETPVRLRLTGAGTVIVRFDRSVLRPRATWSEYSSLDHAVGWSDELRGWAPPGFRGDLTIRGDDFAPVVLDGIAVHEDAPTYLDVTAT